MAKMKTTEEFKKEVYQLVGADFSVVSPYVGANAKISIKHNKCGNTFEISPSYFKHYPRCLVCDPHSRNKARFTTDRFKKKVKEVVGNEYTVLGEYKKASSKIRMRHNKCGQVYEVTPNHFLSQTMPTRCPYCSNGHSRYAKDRVIARLRSLSHDNIKLIGTYVDLKTPILLQCTMCGHKFRRMPQSTFQPIKCPCCYGLANIHSSNDYQELLNKKAAGKFRVSEYVDVQTPIMVTCKRCCQNFAIAPRFFARCYACPYCDKGNVYCVPFSSNGFKKYIANVTNGTYSVVSNFVNMRDKVKIKCNQCGLIFRASPKIFLRNGLHLCCPHCSPQRYSHPRYPRHIHKLNETEAQAVIKIRDLLKIIKKSKTKETRIKRSAKRYHQSLRLNDYDQFTFICDYINPYTQLVIKCHYCGTIFTRIPATFRSHPNCPICRRYNDTINSTHAFKTKIKDLVGTEYLVLSDYHGTHEKIKFKHQKCGHVFYMQPSHFLRGNRCSWCAENDRKSRGEHYIERALHRLGFQAKRDYQYAVVLPNKLHLDFYLPHSKIAIEYDGLQHFQYVPYFHDYSVKNFYHRQRLDRLKDKYCADNNIRLIRIKYDADSFSKVMSILKDKLRGVSKVNKNDVTMVNEK